MLRYVANLYPQTIGNKIVASIITIKRIRKGSSRLAMPGKKQFDIKIARQIMESSMQRI